MRRRPLAAFGTHRAHTTVAVVLSSRMAAAAVAAGAIADESLVASRTLERLADTIRAVSVQPDAGAFAASVIWTGRPRPRRFP